MPRDQDWRDDPNLSAEAEVLRELDRKGGQSVSLDDFYAYMPAHNYLYVPTRTPWPAASVNSRIPAIKLTKKNGRPLLRDGKQVTLSASAWLDRNRPVEQMTWAPGLPMIIPNKLMLEGGWIERLGVNCFNLYNPPTIRPGDPVQAQPWFDHVRYVYPAEADHLLDGWPTGCNALKRRSTTPSCSAARRGLVKTRSWSR